MLGILYSLLKGNNKDNITEDIPAYKNIEADIVTKFGLVGEDYHFIMDKPVISFKGMEKLAKNPAYIKHVREMAVNVGLNPDDAEQSVYYNLERRREHLEAKKERMLDERNAKIVRINALYIIDYYWDAEKKHLEELKDVEFKPGITVDEAIAICSEHHATGHIFFKFLMIKNAVGHGQDTLV